MKLKHLLLVMFILPQAACSLHPVNKLVPFQEGGIDLLATLPDAVLETSGLAEAKGFFWTINDSGDKPRLYQIDQNFKVAKQVTVKGGRNYDWESLAQDHSYLYIADCGDNRGKRDWLQIYKVAWEELGAAKHGDAVNSQVINFRYADKPLLPLGKNHNFDCEAVTVVDNDLWLFTKNRGDGQSSLYIVDLNKRQQELTAKASYPVAGLITAADYDSQSKRLVLLGYKRAKLFGESFIWIVKVKDGLPDWETAGYTALAPYAQWEAVKWSADGTKLWLTSERNPLLEVSIGELVITE